MTRFSTFHNAARRDSGIGAIDWGFFRCAQLRSCLEIRVLEVALRLWSVQGAMGAKIRTVVNY
ncbi:MAG: hypothetical protein BECKG1743D_GA0114223_103204, partial [Candidatus Kentron sp. G]